MSKGVQYGTHSLVNKLTGRKASSSDWLTDLAACALAQGHTQGLPQLLPLDRAAKLLQHNTLKPFKRHQKRLKPIGGASTHAELKRLAQEAFPAIAAYYIKNIVSGADPRRVNKKGFRAWVKCEVEDPTSAFNGWLSGQPKFAPLSELRRSDDWWRTQLKNRE